MHNRTEWTQKQTGGFQFAVPDQTRKKYVHEETWWKPSGSQHFRCVMDKNPTTNVYGMGPLTASNKNKQHWSWPINTLTLSNCLSLLTFLQLAKFAWKVANMPILKWHACIPIWNRQNCSWCVRSVLHLLTHLDSSPRAKPLWHVYACSTEKSSCFRGGSWWVELFIIIRHPSWIVLEHEP